MPVKLPAASSLDIFKVESHANAKHENPLKHFEKNSMCCSKVNVSNIEKN